MKRIYFLWASAALIIISCNKEKTISDGVGAAAFINAAPGVDGTGSDPGIHILIDTVIKTFEIIPYLGSSGYLPETPGTKNIQGLSSLDSITKFFEADEDFEINKGVTYLIYDTLSASDSTLNAIRLTDDLSAPDAGFVKFRFMNAAVGAGPFDVVFVRTTPNDSITLLNQVYLGDSPDGAALSPFSRKLPLGEYIIKLKRAGTQNVLVETPVNFSHNSIYTFYATGMAAGLPLSIGSFKHYP